VETLDCAVGGSWKQTNANACDHTQGSEAA
jgi:hypothetical protein